MGYYDEGNERQIPKRERQKSAWLTAFFSSIFGGLIVVLMLPGLAKFDLLPYDIVTKGSSIVQEMTATEVDSRPTEQTFQVNVSSEIIDAVEKVSEAVVGVINIQQTSDLFARDVRSVERGTGSGVVYEIKDGKAHIVTNYHVIEEAKQIEISLPNGERVQAQLKGADPLTDLAVLEIDAKYIDTIATFGDSDAIRPGEPAIAIGNPLGLEFSRTVTQGIISAKERSVPVSGSWEINVIQTDAAINPGNSGGALINIKGQVIGINSLKIAQQGIEGLGFAIPINDAIPIIEDLVTYGEVQRPYMGVKITDLTSINSYYWTTLLKLPEEINKGVVLYAPNEPIIEPSSPADVAGLKELDVIVQIDDTEIGNVIELRKYLFTKTSIGDTIMIKVYRQGEPINVELTLTSMSNIN
jgi:serine protease Do